MPPLKKPRVLFDGTRIITYADLFEKDLEQRYGEMDLSEITSAAEFQTRLIDHINAIARTKATKKQISQLLVTQIAEEPRIKSRFSFLAVSDNIDSGIRRTPASKKGRILRQQTTSREVTSQTLRKRKKKWRQRGFTVHTFEKRILYVTKKDKNGNPYSFNILDGKRIPKKFFKRIRERKRSN